MDGIVRALHTLRSVAPAHLLAERQTDTGPSPGGGDIDIRTATGGDLGVRTVSGGDSSVYISIGGHGGSSVVGHTLGSAPAVPLLWYVTQRTGLTTLKNHTRMFLTDMLTKTALYGKRAKFLSLTSPRSNTSWQRLAQLPLTVTQTTLSHRTLQRQSLKPTMLMRQRAETQGCTRVTNRGRRLPTTNYHHQHLSPMAAHYRP